MDRSGRIGILALQGDFAAHARAVRSAGGEPIEIRDRGQLPGLSGLILPGGESTALLRLVREYRFDRAIRDYVDAGGHLLGTCAGLILIAREVLHPVQPSLGFLDVSVRRNAFGRQVDSFVDRGDLSINGGPAERVEMVFIRAPRIERLGEGVEVIGRWGEEATLVRNGPIWGATFHPELSDPPTIHRRFLEALPG